MNSQKLYNDTVEVVFYPNCHRYKLKDTKGWLISVTSITGMIDKSRVLMRWCLNLTKEYLETQIDNKLTDSIIEEAIAQKDMVQDEALSVGNQVHEFAEQIALYKLNKGEKPQLPMEESAKNACYAFLKWIKENEITFVDAERFCYSKKYNFAGTTDVLFKIGNDPKIHIGDFKTSKSVYSDYYIQAAGYRIALQEEFCDDFGNNYIIKFGKQDGDFELHTITQEEFEERDKPAFLGALQLKKNIKSIESLLRKKNKNKFK